MTQKFLTPHKTGWIKCSSLKFLQLNELAYRIRVSYLFDLKFYRFLTTGIFTRSASTVDKSLKNVLKLHSLVLSRL